MRLGKDLGPIPSLILVNYALGKIVWKPKSACRPSNSKSDRCASPERLYRRSWSPLPGPARTLAIPEAMKERRDCLLHRSRAEDFNR